MKLEEFEALCHAASPDWPDDFAYADYPSEGPMACGPIISLDGDRAEEMEEAQAQADQDWARAARKMVPKMIRVAKAAEAWIKVAEFEPETLDEAHDWGVACMDAAAETKLAFADLEQP